MKKKCVNGFGFRIFQNPEIRSNLAGLAYTKVTVAILKSN